MSLCQMQDCYVNSQFRLIAFASQLNTIGGAPKSQWQVIVYAHERTFLRSMVYCKSVIVSLSEIAFEQLVKRFQ